MSKIPQSEVIPYNPIPVRRSSLPTPAGDKWMIKAKLSIGPNGEQIAEPGEKIDLDAYIQASRASTDMATIVARAKAGDTSVLNVREGFYGDVDIIPSSINEMDKIRDIHKIADEQFSKLPDEVKALFNNDSGEFLSSVLSNKAAEVVAEYSKTKKQASQEKPETED